MAALDRRARTDGDGEHARRRRAQALLRARGIDPAGVDWAVVPANPATATTLDDEAAGAFRVHLRRLLDSVAAPDDSGDQATRRAEESTRELTERQAEALSSACAACRGWCCARGGSHAFLDENSIARIRRLRPGLETTDLVALYDVFLGPTHLDGGCVFQGPTGCRLPRSLRSDTCNEWWCEDLERVRERWREEGLEPGDVHFLPVLPGPG